MRLIFLASLAGLFAACASTTPEGGPADERPDGSAETIISQVTSPTLSRFSSEEELRAYLEAVEQTAARYYPEPAPMAISDAASSEIVVTASAQVQDSTATADVSITNNQVEGVDEGDIVKRIGNYFVTLQDGRVFTVAIRDAGIPVLDPRARLDVYASADQDTWYDEMLVSGNRIVVTGYSYDADATEIALLRLADDGSLTFERRFFLSSDDYYDTENYATRMIGSKLVLHTPIWLGNLDWEAQSLAFPVIVPDRGGEDRFEMIDGRPLFDVTDIYRPVRELDEPMLHAVSVCDLDTLGTDDFEGCETTAFIAEAEHEVFVAGKDMYVWSWENFGEACETDTRPDFARLIDGTVHRVSLSGEPLVVSAMRGRPVNQFSMSLRDDDFLALTHWMPPCWGWPTLHFALANIPDEGFSRTLDESTPDDYTPLPSLDDMDDIENRFTDSYLLYTGSERSYIYDLLYGDVDIAPGSPLVAVSLDAPEAPKILTLPHSVIRLDRAGATDAVATGYRGGEGLYVTYIDLDDLASIASTTLIEDRFESENRSHAFNALITEEGGIMGLPTVRYVQEAGRWVSRSDASDLSFLTVSGDGQLDIAGTLVASEEETHPDYDCEVSCIDWYGNSRPIFTDDRIFALSVSEVIEARLTGNRIEELRRINLTDPSGMAGR
ncbi:beta-propeller domain-containing protein [Parvularcula marina]|nr:beta-propeller domain-containing protein [Parvularcula marina]